MVKALQKLNSEVKFTRLVNQGHDISKQFNDDELYSWLLKHSREKMPFWQEPLPFMKMIASKKIMVNTPLRPILGYAAISFDFQDE
jgi:hypothetical protein